MYFISFRYGGQEESEDIISVFEKIDSDNDGVINIAEFKSCMLILKLIVIGLIRESLEMPGTQIEILFEEIDLDMDSKIGYSEFLKGSTSLYLLSDNKLAESAFSFFDKDKSGFLEFSEIKNKWISKSLAKEALNILDLNHDSKVKIPFIFNIIDFFGRTAGKYESIICLK